MLKIKLARVGRRNQPSFRIVVSEAHRDPRARHVEVVGHVNPLTKPKTVVIQKERVLYWLSRGAQATPSVHNLFVTQGIVGSPKQKATHLTKKRTARAEEAKSE